MKKMAPKGRPASYDPSARPLCFCGSVTSDCRSIELFKQMAKIICVAEISVHYCFQRLSQYGANDAFLPPYGADGNCFVFPDQVSQPHLLSHLNFFPDSGMHWSGHIWLVNPPSGSELRWDFVVVNGIDCC